MCYNAYTFSVHSIYILNTNGGCVPGLKSYNLEENYIAINYF